MADTFNQIHLVDGDDKPVIQIDGNTGNIDSGGNGHDGDLRLKDAKGRTTIHLNAFDGAVLLGGPEQDGDIKMKNAKDQITVHINGRSGNVHLGGNGEDGDLFIKNGEGAETILLDGKTGEIRVSGDVKIDGDSVQTADFVFETGYELPSLAAVNTFIQSNKHLPSVPSANEMKASGLGLAQFSTVLLQKVEELTLYLIQQNQQIEALQNRISELEATLNN